MSTPAPVPPSSRAKRRERKSQAPGADRLKTVVRRLPANLPEEVFWHSVQPWVSDDTVTWKAFYPGKLRKRCVGACPRFIEGEVTETGRSSRLNKENISSRAYIAFKLEDQLSVFSREYDGHLFRDKAGALDPLHRSDAT